MTDAELEKKAIKTTAQTREDFRMAQQISDEQWAQFEEKGYLRLGG